MKYIQTQNYISAAIYISLPVFFVVAFIIAYNPSGTRTFEYSFDRPTGMISQLFPAHRLEGVSNGSQVLTAQPVYFHARYPRSYDTATVIVSVENPRELVWNIGLEIEGSDDWSYTVEQPTPDGIATFKLDAARITEGNVRFLIGVTDWRPTSEFAIHNIVVTLSRS